MTELIWYKGLRAPEPAIVYMRSGAAEIVRVYKIPDEEVSLGLEALAQKYPLEDPEKVIAPDRPLPI